MNRVFFALVAIAFLATAAQQIQWHPDLDTIAPMQALTQNMVETAGNAVTLALNLIGVMAFFLGLMKVAEKGGLLKILAKLIRPWMIRLFPDVPPDHPAMGAMILNLSANALGLGNAATPFGIRAMQELDRLNPAKGVATNAMVLFLSINTASITLVPTSVIALRAAVGSVDPASILPTTLFASMFSTIVAILAARWLASPNPVPQIPANLHQETIPTQSGDQDLQAADHAYPTWVSFLALGGLIGLVPVTLLFGREISPWVIPGLTVGLLGFGVMRQVQVYEAFVEGAREGFEVAVRIIPYLVAILVAVGMFRVSGALEVMVSWLSPLTSPLGLPAEALPMAFMRSLSGSGAFALMTDLLKNPAIGPDSYTGQLVSTIQGSSETTFYVLAVYYGAVQVRQMRHTLAAALLADMAGIAGSVFICTVLFRH